MDFEQYNLGSGSPRVAIVGSVHGDEILGKKIIERLKDIDLKKGSINFIIAHPEALKKGKRFLKTDLNRSFPGKKNGDAESGLAHKLHQHLKNFDIVIDIHSTNAKFESIVIVTRFDKKIKELLKHIPITTIALIRHQVFGGYELISERPVAVSLDYGPNKDLKSLEKAVRDVKSILRGLGLIAGKSKPHAKKEVYQLTEQYEVPHSFRYARKIHELQYIEKGEVIGTAEGKDVQSRYGFYPLFLHDGRYEGTFALAAKTKKIVEL